MPDSGQTDLSPVIRDGTVRAVSSITVLAGVALAICDAFQLATGPDTTQLVLYLIGGGFTGQVAHRVAER